jgi:hypothetical protein
MQSGYCCIRAIAMPLCDDDCSDVDQDRRKVMLTLFVKE